MTHDALAGWQDVASLLGREGPRGILRIPKGLLPHPAEEGACPTFGLPEGQTGDFCIHLSDRRCLHIQVFARYYEARLYRRDAASPLPIRKTGIRSEAGVAGAAGIGALVGLLVGGKKEAMFVGGLVGLVLGAVATAEARRGKVTSVDAASPEARSTLR